MQEKSIVLPIEVFLRELPYKAPLSIILADLGYSVYLGRQKEITLFWHNLKDFFYIDKSAAKTKKKLFKDIQNCGGNIGVYCEEGLVFKNGKQYLAERVDENSFDYIDIFWAWGPEHFKLVSHKFGKNKLEIITSPRIGLLYNLVEINKRKKYEKNSILFMTSFGIIDNKIRKLEILKKRGTFDSDIGENFYLDLDKYLKEYRKKFILLIKECLKEFPEYKFILKIHPSEKKINYKELINENNNLSISENESSAEVISKSEIVISSISTTSIEADILKKSNSIVYLPINDKRFIPKIIEKNCSIFSKKKLVKNYLKSRKKKDILNNSIRSYLKIESNNSIEILRKYSESIHKKYKSCEIKNKKKIYSFLIRFKYSLKHHLRSFLYSVKLKKYDNRSQKKCGDISFDDIFQNANNYLSIDRDFKDLKNLYKIEKISKNIFKISKRKK